MFKEFDTWLRNEGPVFRFFSYAALIFVSLGILILLILFPLGTLGVLLFISGFFSVTFSIAVISMFLARKRQIW